MDIKLISGALGAEIQGVDLKDPSEKNFETIRKSNKIHVDCSQGIYKIIN